MKDSAQQIWQAGLGAFTKAQAEGNDKVAKYPVLFQLDDVILLTKMDLAGVLEYDKHRVYEDLKQVNTRAPLIEISAKTGETLPALDMRLWLEAKS